MTRTVLAALNGEIYNFRPYASSSSAEPLSRVDVTGSHRVPPHLYLNAHWFSDVLGGFTGGAAAGTRETGK